MNKPKRLLYLLAIMPGLGHFYLGLMTRGLQFMLLFFGTIFLTNLIGSFGFFLPIIVFYSYFDALQSYSKYREGYELTDEPIIKNMLFKVNKKIIGWILIGFGFFMLLDNAYYYLPAYIQNSFDRNLIQNIVFSAIFVVLGIRLLSGKKNDEI